MSSSLFQTSQNPARNNQQMNSNGMKQVNDYLQRTGQTPEQAVRSICKERGINVEQLLQMVKNMT